MPELPEVETIRRDLSQRIIGKSINKQKIKNISRRGKLLILKLPNKFLLIHLGMTGQLIYKSKNQITVGGHEGPDISKYTRKRWKISSGDLLFNDARKFGYYKYVKKLDLSKYGPEPENFSFQKSQAKIKPYLLNQKNIAGIGNIYADEILFHAGIRPTRRINKLSKKEKMKIKGSIKYILSKAIEKRGTTFADYRDAKGERGNYKRYLKVYGREDLLCKKCKLNNIKKIKLAGRGTHYCRLCQN